MAEPTSLNLAAIQAVVTWLGTDGQTNHMYRKDDDPTFQVTLDMKYDGVQGQSRATGLFRLRVPVHLKSSPHEKTSLMLYIRPERIASLLAQQKDEPEMSDAQVDDVDTLVRAKLGPRIVCLKFVLNDPADMVVPSGVPLVPTKQNPHGEQMDLLKYLAQSTSFSIFLKAQDVSLPLLHEFVDATNDRTRSIRSNTDADDLASLYTGQSGRVLDGAELSANGTHVVPPLPPSYNNVGAPPPMVPLDQEEVGGPSTSSESRKRRRDSDMDEASSAPGVEAACKSMVENILLQARQEDRAFMTKFVGTEIQALRSEIQTLKSEIQTLKSEIMTEIRTNKTEMTDCTDELEHRISDVERGVEEFDDRIDVQVDDATVGYKIEVEEEKENFKSEMREFVTERLEEVQESAVEEVEERVMDRLNGARVLVEQASIRLD